MRSRRHDRHAYRSRRAGPPRRGSRWLAVLMAVLATAAGAVFVEVEAYGAVFGRGRASGESAASSAGGGRSAAAWNRHRGRPSSSPSVTASPSASPSPRPTSTPPAGMRPLPDPLYGVTVDDVSDVDAIVASSRSLARMPTTRIVFDEGQPASYYADAVNRMQPSSYLMGEILDSYYVDSYSVREYRERVGEYLRAFGDKIDLWEIGNEINGEWLGSTDSVVAKVTDAYDQVKAAGKRTVLTLYYNPDCWEDSDHEMFAWTEANIPAAMKQGLDYVLISYYDSDCNDYRPADWTPVFSRLHKTFPNSKLGFGEVGFANPATSATLARQQAALRYYYGLEVAVPGYVGGYFWWNYAEDMLPHDRKPLWQTLDTAVQQY